jgi:hypothetical protein
MIESLGLTSHKSTYACTGCGVEALFWPSAHCPGPEGILTVLKDAFATSRHSAAIAHSDMASGSGG